MTKTMKLILLATLAFGLAACAQPKDMTCDEGVSELSEITLSVPECR